MRTAIVHYWLLGMRGGEKVVEALCRLLPDADIFTLFYAPGQVSETIRRHRVVASWLDPFRNHHRSLLPLMPLALESFDLRGYDLIVSSESGPAKGILAPSAARHVCYCHTPMRYLWDLYPAYRNEYTRSSLKRGLMAPLAHWLRMWDYSTAARVDDFIANSENVRRRIWKTYRRESRVIHPPVDVDSFFYKPPRDYYLVVSELVAYKRIAEAVRVFSRTGRKLKVVGSGPEYPALREMAGPSVEFCGRVDDAGLRELYASCRAFIMPGEEDFGITPVEALASGKPVIALARGGAIETVGDQGVLYLDSLEEAVTRFEREESRFHPTALRASAERFSITVFEEAMRGVLAGGESVQAAR